MRIGLVPVMLLVLVCPLRRKREILPECIRWMRKGVRQFSIIFKHALRNAVLPVVTYLAPMIAFMVTGNFVVENVFVIPGLGKEFISSIMNRDYTMIMGTTIFLSAILISLNVLVDIAYKIIDPRIQLS